jgi:hypothetical protein
MRGRWSAFRSFRWQIFEGGDPSLTFGEAPQVRLARQK